MRTILGKLKRRGTPTGTRLWLYIRGYGGPLLLGQGVYTGHSIRYMGFNGDETPREWKSMAKEFRSYNKRAPILQYVEVGSYRGPAVFAE